MLRSMIIVSVIYPKNGESQFNSEYYVEKHCPLVWAHWGGMGLSKLEVLQGVGSRVLRCHSGSIPRSSRRCRDERGTQNLELMSGPPAHKLQIRSCYLQIRSYYISR